LPQNIPNIGLNLLFISGGINDSEPLGLLTGAF
jgi:hypothetical protein